MNNNDLTIGSAMQELTDQIKRAEIQRDLYRQRAIDEVLEHHKDATVRSATFDVDRTVLQHLQMKGTWL